MTDCTNAELADMHLAYGAADCSGPNAQRSYEERHPIGAFPVVHYNKLKSFCISVVEGKRKPTEIIVNIHF